MAELLAIHQDLKNLVPITTLYSDGSADIKLTGNKIYHPELKLTRTDVISIMKDLSETSRNIIPLSIPFTV
jgi:hypothetical protein